MFATSVSFDLPSFCCKTCSGKGYVDDEFWYEDPTRFETFTGDFPTMPCRICYGTGRHVARARAGLAAPPTIMIDIETMGLLGPSEPAWPMKMHWKIDEATLAKDQAEADAAIANLKIIDDIQPPDHDELAARARIKAWFETMIPSDAAAQLSAQIFSTRLRAEDFDIETVEKRGQTSQFFFNGREHLLKEPR